MFQLNNETFYCFPCKKIYQIDSLNDHWKDVIHTGKLSQTGETDGKPIQCFDVDKENGLVTCRICKQTLPLTFQSVYGHRRLHSDTIPVENKNKGAVVYEEAFRLLLFPDHGELRHKLKLFGKDNHIKMITGGAKGYCNICCTYISSHMINFKEHVKGARHQGFLEIRGFVKKTKKPEKYKYTTKPMLQYVETFIHINEISAFWVNKTMCVSIFSFMLLSPIDHDKDKMHCFLCDKIISSDMMGHYQLVHREDYVNTQVITSIPDEFIREVNVTQKSRLIADIVGLKSKHLEVKVWNIMYCPRNSQIL